MIRDLALIVAVWALLCVAIIELEWFPAIYGGGVWW